MRPSLPFAALALLALSACVPAPERPGTAGFTPASRAAAGGLIGLDARGLQRLLGKPRLDIRDPATRKLQFGGSRCILDAYLYPPASGRGEPLVTYVEARTPTGTAVDANACAQALRGN
jgi:hypothetical protein